MSPPPRGTAATESKRYVGMALGALALALLTMGLVVPAYNLLPEGMAQAYLILVALFALFVALILALISLVKMRNKVLPLLALLASALPFFGSLCCGGTVLGLVYGVDFLQGNNPLFAPKPKVEWDTAPTAIIAQAAHPFRHMLTSIPPEYTRNYIPEARLWGDGRIVWAAYESSGEWRLVTEGQLTSAQMTALLQQFVDAGFFGWNDSYFSLFPYDNPPIDYLTVNLLAAKKTVGVSLGGNPPAKFDSLLKALINIPGVEVKVFTPTQGTLIAIPTEEPATINWDQENLNLDLSKAAEGIPVEGKALQLAWEVVNKNPYYPPPVSLNGVMYTLYVIIPGLMY